MSEKLKQEAKKMKDKALKREEEIKKRHQAFRFWMIFGVIILILWNIIMLNKPLREKMYSLFENILPFLRVIPSKLKNLFETITSDRNKFTSIMSVFTLAIIGGFIFTIINSVENPYDKANSILWLVLGILSILPIVFFIIRLRNKDRFFAGDNNEGNTMFGQLKNILTIMKENFKTSATILSVLLAIVIFGLITLSSDNAFVSTSTGIMVMIGVIAMFVGYTIISNSDFFEKYIKNNQVLQLLFNLIFIIPCIIALAFNWISEQLKNTPSFVYTILLLEIVIIALYFIIPSVDRTLYFSLSNKKSNLNDLQEIMRMNKQQKEDLQKQVFQLKQALFKKSHSQNVKYMNKQGVNDNWDELFKLYSNFESKDQVKSRLIDLGFCEKEDSVEECDEILNERIEYIKNTQAKINVLQQQINSIKTELSPAEKLVDNTNPNIEGSDDMKEIRDAVVLQMKPVSLKKTTTPKSSEEINLFTNIANQPNYSYALSFWLFVHPQSGHVKDCNNVINFDNRPQILYCPVYKKIPKGELVDYIDDKGNKITKAKVTKSTLLPNNTANYNLESMDGKKYLEVHHSNIKYKYPYSVLKFVLGSSKETQKEYALPNLKMQKWNNIVVNFIDGTYDLFVNGEMVNSFQGVMEDFSYDNIQIGEDNGVSGGIANVLFYKNYLTKDKIISNYNLLKNKNPPIITDLLKV